MPAWQHFERRVTDLDSRKQHQLTGLRRLLGWRVFRLVTPHVV
jgi:hypothetical protein